MSCQVCHRMICRCGPDLTEALLAQAELHIQIYRIKKELSENAAKIATLNKIIDKALHAFRLISIGTLCNPRETAMKTYNQIKQMQNPEETPDMKGAIPNERAGNEQSN